MLSFFKKIFSGRHPAGPTSWQPLKRTAAQQRAHEQWVAQQVYLNWMGPFFKAYHFQKTGVCAKQLRVQLIKDEARQGALFFYDPSIGPGNFRHLFDFIRDQLIAQGYNAAVSDQRLVKHERYTESIEKHFLKPQPHDCTATGRCNQRFGNVTVDLVSINGQPGFIRFVANPYQDAIFTPAASFDSLMDTLFNLPPAPPEVQQLIKQYHK
ncbi:hypothetical protein [Hymenobacter chitinivorans]|uniref:Uncharacterized protein n=1 Tax=Hymenobacter chitinivorans DSM 11115 TaxID=1121954 RepID=A0A2M9BQP9_9BACT|nr:hypothetical protein [Hymenobacter chitinivorans]PJJ60258.1 hypothetical protein CLV45_1683 [Hymenobacter chitinivorans DSM 11115]